MNPLHDITAVCPYCGETFPTCIDTSAGDQVYIEDCQVCCQPIVFEIMLDPDLDTPTVVTRRDNE